MVVARAAARGGRAAEGPRVWRRVSGGGPLVPAGAEGAAGMGVRGVCVCWHVMLFSLTGLGGFLRSPEGAHVCYSTVVINSLGHMLRLGWKDTASRIPARRENLHFN